MKHQGLQEFLQPPVPPREVQLTATKAATGFRKKSFCRSLMRASSSRPAYPFKQLGAGGGQAGLYPSFKHSPLITALYRWQLAWVLSYRRVGSWLDKVSCQATHRRA